jgi:hypothetical protein
MRFRMKGGGSMVNFLRALAVSVLAYVGIFLAVILSPIVIVLCLWTGLCLFGAAFMFFFWLLITHNPSTLRGSLYLLAWGSPACLTAGVLGYYRGQLRARRTVRLVSLQQDAPFQ